MGTGYVGRERFTAHPHTVDLLRKAADRDPRYTIMHISGDLYEWVHHPDENGKGTAPNNDRSDFTRWVGGVLTTHVRIPKKERLSAYRVTLESTAPIRQVL